LGFGDNVKLESPTKRGNGTSKRREAGVITEPEDGIRTEILTGLIQDKDGETHISTSMRVLAETIASDVSLLISFNRAIEAVIKNNQKPEKIPRRWHSSTDTKGRWLAPLSANLQRFGFERIAKIENLEQIFSETAGTSENSTQDVPGTTEKTQEDG
jgi:hypothetical protein